MSPASDMTDPPRSDMPRTDPFAIPPPDLTADAAARLERALERIAVLAHPAAAVPATSPATAEVAARLDVLILRVRAALGDEHTMGKQPNAG